MTPELDALGRRAIACDGWRWMVGMLALILSGAGCRRVLSVDEDRVFLAYGANSRAGWVNGRAWGAIPDFSDPATLGCLLALVREAWGDASMHVRSDTGGDGGTYWAAYSGAGKPHGSWCTSEAVALVSALEAADLDVGCRKRRQRRHDAGLQFL